MWQVESKTIEFSVTEQDTLFSIPVPARGILSRIVLVQVAGTGILPYLDLYESRAAAFLSSSSPDSQPENNEESTQIFDPACYKVCPQLEGSVINGRGIIEVHGETSGYSYFIQDFTRPKVGSSSRYKSNTRKMWARLHLVSDPGNNASHWNLSVRVLVPR